MIEIDGIGGRVGMIGISNNTFNAIFPSERAIKIANATDVTIGYNVYKTPIKANSFINVKNLRTAPGEQ